MNLLKFFNILLQKSGKSYYGFVVIASLIVDFLKITTAVANCNIFLKKINYSRSNNNYSRSNNDEKIAITLCTILVF